MLAGLERVVGGRGARTVVVEGANRADAWIDARPGAAATGALRQIDEPLTAAPVPAQPADSVQAKAVSDKAHIARRVVQSGAVKPMRRSADIHPVARVIAVAVVVLLSLRPAAAAPDDRRGWGWLVEKLVADGLDRGRVERAFDDPRMEPFDGLDFGLSAGREPRWLYRGFVRPAGIAAARRCREAYGGELDRAAAAEGVPASVVAAIMYVESGCGRNTGSSMILHRLARLAMANEPANLRRNLGRHAPDGDPEVEARVRARARYLEDTFYPEVRGVFLVAERLDVDPLALHGSGSGAFGEPQFLPTSYLEHGADGDGDGRVDLYDPADAALSCASFLKAKGWHNGLSTAERRRVIWAYNHSDAYIDAVLAVARAIDRPATATAAASARGKRHGGRHTTVAAASQTKKAAASKKKTAPSRKHSASLAGRTAES